MVRPLGLTCSQNTPTRTFIGAREGNRTPDLRITSALLCRLSYPGNGWSDYRPVAGTDMLGRAMRRSSSRSRSFTLRDNEALARRICDTASA